MECLPMILSRLSHLLLLVLVVTLSVQGGDKEPSAGQKSPGVVVGRITSDPGTGRRYLSFELAQQQVNVVLVPVEGLISPSLRIRVREGEFTTDAARANYSSCLLAGTSEVDGQELSVALSTCGIRVMGTVVWGSEHYTVETDTRFKRDTNEDNSKDDMIIVKEETKKGGECGLNKLNKKRLMAEKRPVVKISQESRRTKRATMKRYIEVSIFVDDIMYQNVNNNKNPGEDTLKNIQDIVFAYLNAVQIMYQSDKLTNKLHLVLVRLDIMKAPVAGLNKNNGEIESYLDAFCQWQKKENPGSVEKGDLTDPEHWDHALLLTGLNLYDGRPSRDSVIGLAWVSGMCHPDYSCTINEGNNFESVYVIAHEMGHNLGMNHDGEGVNINNCDPDKFLMSPVLGPGKVTWSSCSNQELANFLTDSKTQGQSACLNDVPTGTNLNALVESPGRIFSAMDQCQQSFGKSFKPHVKPESPFEDLCRELWCSNLTHAMRAHPAIEGTDCSSKPYPYGSVCHEGVCSPFSPDTNVINPNPSLKPASSRPYDSNNTNTIDDAPSWYDPIFTVIFTRLRDKISKENPLIAAAKIKRFLEEDADDLVSVELHGDMAHPVGVWHLEVHECPVECGGGWAGVHLSCQSSSGMEVDASLCSHQAQPSTEWVPCSTQPCHVALNL